MPYTFQAMTPEGQWVPGPPRGGLVPSPWCPARQLGGLGTAPTLFFDEATVKAALQKVQTAAKDAGFYTGTISGTYDAALHEALSRWAKSVGFALWKKQVYNLPSSRSLTIGGTRVRAMSPAGGDGPVQTVITWQLQPFLAERGLRGEVTAAVWKAHKDGWDKKSPSWWDFGGGFVCPQGTTATTSWRGGSYCAGPSGAVCPPGYTKQVSNPGTKSESVSCVLSMAPPEQIPQPVEGACPEKYRFVADPKCRKPDGSLEYEATGRCVRIPQPGDPPLPAETPRAPIILPDCALPTIPPGPQPPAEVKTEGAKPGWLEENWKWLAALAVVGGGAYYYAKRKAAGQPLFGRIDPVTFRCDSVMPPTVTGTRTYECYKSPDFVMPEAVFDVKG